MNETTVQVDPTQWAGLTSYLENVQQANLEVIGLLVVLVLLVGFVVGYLVAKK